MRHLLPFALACGAATTLVSCSANNSGSAFQNGGNGPDAGLDALSDTMYLPESSASDADDAEAGNVYQPDAPADTGDCPPQMSQPCTAPKPSGCQATEICGNGLDDDCNGKADDGCSCTPGAVQSCFLGPPGHAGVGACVSGTQTCEGTTEFGTWGKCVDGLWPMAEVCDGLDNDCNGCVDDGLCCQPAITCPNSADVPEGHPFVPYQMDGKQWYSGPATAWKWQIEGGPCDALLGASYKVTGDTTATPTINFTLSGDYTVTMTVTTPSGDLSCTFVLHISGPGMRVELCWEGTGTRDVDLHLLRSDFHSDWCNDQYDCYYWTCKASSPWKMQSWNYTDSALAECVGGPEGADWSAFHGGACANPRLDIDNIDTYGIPENINVDAPLTSQTFRVMVHYYDGVGEPHPMVNIYCDGHRVATYGQAPDVVTGFTESGSDCSGTTWRVADVKTNVSSGSTVCDIQAMHPPSQSTGYYLRNNSKSYD